jgi:signal transduction histidine kinase/CheY-like chemotaxis protein
MSNTSNQRHCSTPKGGGILTRASLRSKLQRATLGIWLLVSAVTLGGVAIAQYRDSAETAAHSEQGLRLMLQEKSRILLANQTLALRSMALENAFSDVQQLVHRTVFNDPDVVYGIYTDAENSAWVFVGPGMPDAGLHSRQADVAWEQQRLVDHRGPSHDTQTRAVSAFGRQLQERRADVYDGLDHLGTIRYGFSTLRTELTVQRELQRARRALWKTLALVAGLGFAGLGLGAFAIRRAAKRITLPLAELSRASTEIAQGNRSCRAQVTSGDELQNLANAFNFMAEATETTMRELQVKTEEALAASRMKSEFLANMSHEIRTPMNGILGVVKLMQKLPLEGKMRRYVETVDSSASALLTIINDVLDFSKMEAGKYTLQSIAFDIHTVVQEVVELLAPRAHEKGIEIVHRIAPDVSPLLRGDPDRTRQVLNNLVGNAIKFTDSGEVLVDVSAEPSISDDEMQTILVAVRDTGIGIDEADLGKLFDAFSQVDGSMVRKFGGTGLGLAISRHLVEMMGGTIGVNSTPGRGSEFWFKVPLPQEPQPPPSANHSWVAGKRVLLVEPCESWRRVIQEHCADWGFEVVCTDAGESARAQLARLASEREPCSIAVVSTQLTDMVFEDLVHQLHSDALTGGMPIIALYQLGLGAKLGEIEKDLAAQLPKPLRYSELYDTLQRVLVGNVSSHSYIHTSERLPLRSDKQVLVVDDNEVNRLVAGETLEAIGYRVALAENGAEAVEMMKKEDYLLVLMDCQMPIMDGYAATRAVREWEKQAGRHTTIVALTAHALSGEKERVLAAGMDDYLTKPVRASSLDKMIRRYASSPPVGEAEAATATAVESALSTSVSRSRKLVELFMKHVPLQINDIDRAASEQNAADLRSHAHKTKGSCLAFGAPRMARTSERLQRLAEESNLREAPELIALLRKQYEEVLSELRNGAS